MIVSLVRWQSLITSASDTEKEKSQMYEIGAKDIIEKILPVVDNFERGSRFHTGRGKRYSVCRRNGEDLQAAYDDTGFDLE